MRLPIKLGKLKKAAFLMLLGITFSKLCSYGFRLIASRLGTEVYGTLSLALALFGFVSIFGLLGLHEGVLRFVSYHHKDKQKQQETIKTAILVSFLSSLLFAIILFLQAGFLEEMFSAPGLAEALRIFSFAIPFASFAWIFVYGLRSLERIKAAVFAQQFTEGASKITFTLIFIGLGMGLSGLILGYTLSVISVSIVSGIFLYLSLTFFTKGISSMQDLLDYSIPLMFTGFLYYIVYYTDTLMIGYFLDTTAVGIYNVALPTAAILFMIPEAILVLFVPLMTKHYADNNK